MAAARLHVSLATPDSKTTATRRLGAWLQRSAPASAKGDVSIAVVSDRRMRALNRQFRGKDTATDVLSFPATQMPGVSSFLGDVVIVAPLIDRLMHHGHLLKFDGKSWRLKEAAARIAKASAEH